MSGTTDDASALFAAAKHAWEIAQVRTWERTKGEVTESQARALPEVQAILNASADLRRQCLILASLDEESRAAFKLVTVIARETVGLTAEDLAALLPAMAAAAVQGYGRGDLRLKAQTGLVEDAWGRLDEEARGRLAPEVARVAVATAEHIPAITARLRKLLDAGPVPYDLIFTADNVGTALRAVIAADGEPDAVRGTLVRLLADFPAAGKPGEQWIADARNVAGQFSDSPGLIGALLDAAIDAEDFELKRRYRGTAPAYVTKGNEPVVCGLAVLAGQVAAAGAADLLPRLRTLALKAITMIGRSESRSIRLATSCVSAIEDAALPASITELLRTERSTRHGTLLRQVRTSVDALAAAQGMGRDELLERSVEDHGLAADGTRRVTLADGWTALLSAGARTAAVEYAGPDGKPRKSLPAPVKHASAGALGPLAADLKAVRATIGNERSRIEGLLGSGRPLDLAPWRELYRDHPVTGRLARALIWTFTPPGGVPVTGIPVGESEVLLCDAATAAIPVKAEVTLWHPAGADAGEVAAWRRLLLDREMVQPVKQAFREVYLVTPAEEGTGDYSNRFAAHILRQQQALALMKARGWMAEPVTPWDTGKAEGTSQREFARAGIRAEFFFDPAEEHPDDLNTFVASDQVRFFEVGSGDAVPLARVPPLVFSEAMRDVDLFIGVATIGADPEWTDRGSGRRFDDYWRRWGFGELNAGAEVRREVLERLLPMLAIADRCALESRFLVVRGDLRTYKIHIGSGNILMSPNDQYLCIVAARGGAAGAAGKVFLPFDDDHVLSMILSKAFLLAADAKITDPSIARQIGHGG